MLSDQRQIHGLPACRTLGGHRLRQFVHERDTVVARRIQVRQGQKGVRLQRIADQDRSGFAELDVHGRKAASKHVVVHRGQIVVDQSTSVHHLDGGAGVGEHVRRRVGQCAGSQTEQGAGALPAMQGGVAHRRHKLGLTVVFGAEKTGKRLFDPLCAVLHPDLRQQPAGCAAGLPAQTAERGIASLVIV